MAWRQRQQQQQQQPAHTPAQHRHHCLLAAGARLAAVAATQRGIPSWAACRAAGTTASALCRQQILLQPPRQLLCRRQFGL